MTDTRTRAAELYERFARIVATRLERRYRGVDPQRVADAVVDAILGAAGGADARTLTGLARQRLRVLLRGDVRRRHREGISRPPGGGSVSLEDREFAATLRDRIATTPEERHALDGWLTGTPADATVVARLRQRIHRLKAKVPRDP